jgi:hypothetical protein
MAALDPVQIFTRLCRDIPPGLRRHIIVTGSLAAAYEYRVKLQLQAVNTKDADLVIHPAGDVLSARDMTRGLINLGWRPTENCNPMPNPDRLERLRAIRLTPPDSTDYIIELLNVPVEEQGRAKEWIPVQLPDGWYGLPSFKFMGLTTHDRRQSSEGLEYASPAMMALANLLSHQTLTDDEIESGEFVGILRCAKDLGRVIALASLAGREATSAWVPHWRASLEKCFPKNWPALARRAGDGLRQLLADEDILEQARKTTESGLLKGRGYDIAALRAFGQRLLLDAVDEFERQASKAR